jgi:Zn-finger nucleic acid-binding protein
MKCPTDSATLVMSERAGIEIDYCPECRGVWLDRGELDKILDRATADVPAPAPAQRQYAEPRYDDRPAQPYRKKKKEHWLTELFD